MIYRAKKEDAQKIAEMAILMWEDNTVDGLIEEFEEMISGNESALYIYEKNNQPIGFAQCQLRHDYVEGTDSSPVGYLEGIFIRDGYRKQGYARELLAKCEAWAKGMGCSEFASNCELTNTGSLAFHLHMGFEEANRIICFTKRL